LVSGNLKTSTAAFSPLFKRGVTYGLVTDFTNSNELFYYQGSTGSYASLIAQNGLYLRGSTTTTLSTTGRFNAISMPDSSFSASPLTLFSANKTILIDYGLGSIISGYTTGIQFASYDGFDNYYSTLSIQAQNAANDYILPNDSGTIALLNPTKTQTFTSVLRAGSGLCASGGVTFSGPAEFDSLARFDAGLCASGGATFGGGIISDAFILNSNGIKSLTGTTYTFLTSDSGKVLTFNNGSTVTVTIPTALPIGFSCTAIQLGAGQVGFTRASGVTLNSYGNQFKLIGQHATATITEYATDIVNISGNLIV
jgi:hypothetical protein